MKRLLNMMLLTFMILFVLSACGAKNASDNKTSSTVETIARGDRKEEPASEAKNDSYDHSGSTGNYISNRKIIENVNLEMETLTFDKTYAEVLDLVKYYKGYTENSNINGTSIRATYRTKSASFTFRIPAENITFFTQDLEKMGNIINQNMYTDDVTYQYFDMDSRLKSLRTQEERLLAILEKADELKDVIELEKALSDVRYEIENYTTQLRYLDNQVSYATMNMSLYEVIEETEINEPPKTFGDKISQGFSSSIKSLKVLTENLVLFLIVASPYLVIIGIIVVVVLKVVKKSKKNNMDNDEDNLKK